MHVYIVFAHPSRKSLTWEILKSFERGLHDAGHTSEIGDLYAMNFQTDMDLAQYEREMGPDPDAPVPDDVKREQEKIERADALAFVYPVWWSDCPAKLKGWFDRVLTLGYSYWHDESGHRRKPTRIDQALLICPAGQGIEELERSGVAQSMRVIMINDRMPGLGVRHATMEILAGTADDDGTTRRRHIERAYELGATMGRVCVAT